MATTSELEQKVHQLESQLQTLQERIERIEPNVKGNWRSMAGWAKDDPYYDEAMRLGAEHRRQVNEESLRQLGQQTNAGS